MSVIEGEREIPHVNAKGGKGDRKSKMMAMAIFGSIVLVFGGYFSIKLWRQNRATQQEQPVTQTVKAPASAQTRTFVMPPEPPKKKEAPKPKVEAAPPAPAPIPPVVIAQPAPPPIVPATRQSGGKKELDPVEQLEQDRNQSSLILTKARTADDDEEYGGFPGQGQTSTGNSGKDGSIGQELRATSIPGRKAARLIDRTFLLSRNTYIPCVLETRIVTTVAGMTSCRVTHDVYSANGKMRLIERGSRVSGEYASGQLKQGDGVIFVLWNRVDTPNGVTIPLDSPGTDALGASGHDGYIETHFFKRFGGAIMLSLIGDLADYANARASNGDNNINVAGNSADTANNMAAEALRHTINIPPTMTKNQGELISITVARDMDFRDVYTVQPR